MKSKANSWKTVSLAKLVVDPSDDIVDGPFGSRLKASEYVNSGVPIVRLQNIDRNRFIDKNIKFVTSKKASEIARHHFVAGDVLVSKLGDPLGEACIAPVSIPYGILVADVVRVRPNKAKVDNAFLTYALNSAPVVAQFEAETKGTTRPRVNLRKIRELQIPLVESLDEQREIVAEIEKQFTRLEAGVAGLRRVQANLKRYRAAVLKAACEGKLVPTDTSLWARAISGTIITKIEAGKSFRCEERSPNINEVGVVKVSAVTWGKFDERETKTCLDTSRIDERYFIRPGDFLFSRANTIDLVGACVIASTVTLKLMLSDKILRFRFMESVMPHWILYWLRSEFGRKEIQRLSTGNQESMRNIGQDRIRQISIAIPPFAEQQRIVGEVERRLSVVEELEVVVNANLQRATRLRQSILQRAFSGLLISQPFDRRSTSYSGNIS